jgi:molecular chaperone GrpE
MTTRKVHKDNKTTKSSPGQTKKKLEHTIVTLQKELTNKNEKLLRSLADIQNQQKRFQKELQIHEQQTKTKYLLELLDLKELLQKAYEDKDPKKGLKLLIANINSFLEKENIQHINCKGKLFDHELHHAVTVIEDATCDDNIIVDEIKKGYKQGDTLLRPSHVVVTKKKQSD